MRALHRIVVGLMLLVFTSATVLAGPLRLCVGTDDHLAIEFAASLDQHAHFTHKHYAVHDHEHGHDHDEVSSVDCGLALHKHEPSCVDVPIIQAVVAAAKPEAEKNAAEPAAMPVEALILKLAAFALPAQIFAANSAPEVTGKISGLRLAALRTVILTI